MSEGPQIVVAGHICLDIIPCLDGVTGGLEAICAPGRLVNIGPSIISTGGPVSNTGLALHRLGLPVSLMGKVGDDLIGQTVLAVLRGHAPQLADGMIVAQGEHTSYTVVLSPPGVDRVFLHCTGANDTFCPEDIDLARLRGVRLFHFGYPPLMKRMYEEGGAQLATLLRRAKAAGPTISLDMAFVDPASAAGRADWPALLKRALPHVDVFVPSLDETLFMLDRARFERLQAAAGPEGLTAHVDGQLLAELSGRLLAMGPAIVMLKLGDQGAYLRTTADARRLAAAGAARPADVEGWRGRELLAPCFAVQVVGTTGSGDCTIAGFLAGLLHGLSAQGAMTAAVGTGACNVEAADATSGIPPWSAVQARIAAGWPRREVRLCLDGWRQDQTTGLHIGPNDKRMS